MGKINMRKSITRLVTFFLIGLVCSTSTPSTSPRTSSRIIFAAACLQLGNVEPLTGATFTIRSGECPGEIKVTNDGVTIIFEPGAGYFHSSRNINVSPVSNLKLEIKGVNWPAMTSNMFGGGIVTLQDSSLLIEDSTLVTTISKPISLPGDMIRTTYTMRRSSYTLTATYSVMGIYFKTRTLGSNVAFIDSIISVTGAGNCFGLYFWHSQTSSSILLSNTSIVTTSSGNPTRGIFLSTITGQSNVEMKNSKITSTAVGDVQGLLYYSSAADSTAVISNSEITATSTSGMITNAISFTSSMTNFTTTIEDTESTVSGGTTNYALDFAAAQMSHVVLTRSRFVGSTFAGPVRNSNKASAKGSLSAQCTKWNNAVFDITTLGYTSAMLTLTTIPGCGTPTATATISGAPTGSRSDGSLTATSSETETPTAATTPSATSTSSPSDRTSTKTPIEAPTQSVSPTSTATPSRPGTATTSPSQSASENSRTRKTRSQSPSEGTETMSQSEVKFGASRTPNATASRTDPSSSNTKASESETPTRSPSPSPTMSGTATMDSSTASNTFLTLSRTSSETVALTDTGAGPSKSLSHKVSDSHTISATPCVGATYPSIRPLTSLVTRQISESRVRVGLSSGSSSGAGSAVVVFGPVEYASRWKASVLDGVDIPKTLVSLELQETPGQQPNPAGFKKYPRSGFHVVRLNDSFFSLSLSSEPAFKIEADEEVIVVLAPDYFAFCAPSQAIPLLRLSVEAVPSAAVVATKKAAEVISGTATIASFAGSSGAALDAQSLAVIGLMSCAQPAERGAMKNNRLLSPLATGNTYDGMIAGNWILVCVVLTIHYGVACVVQQVKKIKAIEAHIFTRFPTLTLVAVTVQYQGTASACIKLLQSNPAPPSILLGVVTAAFAFAIPVALLLLARKVVTANYHAYAFDAPQVEGRFNKLARLLLPTGRWYPVDMRKRFSCLFAGLRRSEKIWVTLPTWSPTVIVIGLMFQPGSQPECVALFGVMSGIQFVFVAIVLGFRPYRSGPANILAAASNMCLGFILCGSAMLASDPESETAIMFTLRGVQAQMAITIMRIMWGITQFILEHKVLNTVPMEEGHAWVSTDEVARQVRAVEDKERREREADEVDEVDTEMRPVDIPLLGGREELPQGSSDDDLHLLGTPPAARTNRAFGLGDLDDDILEAANTREETAANTAHSHSSVDGGVVHVEDEMEELERISRELRQQKEKAEELELEEKKKDKNYDPDSMLNTLMTKRKSLRAPIAIHDHILDTTKGGRGDEDGLGPRYLGKQGDASLVGGGMSQADIVALVTGKAKLGSALATAGAGSSENLLLPPSMESPFSSHHPSSSTNGRKTAAPQCKVEKKKKFMTAEELGETSHFDL